MTHKKNFLIYSRVTQLVLFSFFSLLLSSLFSELFPVWAAENDFSQNGTTKLSLISAVQQTLSKQPSIKIAAQEVVSKSAFLQEADGRFDLMIGSSLGYHETFMPLSRAQELATGKSSRDEGVGDFTLSLNQELVNGILLQQSLSITRTDDQSFGAETQNDASVNFSLIIPLQKGWGRDVVEADVRSARV
ncbi:MAG: hypothetical protein U9Q58_05700, partial [Pseudomonadota bacterium]|nr:hypothetical protein [Pseudomonadota bacterium]